MTKKNTFAKRLARFMLWLGKACIVTYAIISAAIVAAFSTWQGAVTLIKEHGLLWALPILGGFGMVLHFIWSECPQTKREEVKSERDEAAPPEKPGPGGAETLPPPSRKSRSVSGRLPH